MGRQRKPKNRGEAQIGKEPRGQSRLQGGGEGGWGLRSDLQEKQDVCFGGVRCRESKSKILEGSGYLPA